MCTENHASDDKVYPESYSEREYLKEIKSLIASSFHLSFIVKSMETMLHGKENWAAFIHFLIYLIVVLQHKLENNFSLVKYLSIDGNSILLSFSLYLNIFC